MPHNHQQVGGGFPLPNLPEHLIVLPSSATQVVIPLALVFS